LKVRHEYGQQQKYGDRPKEDLHNSLAYDVGGLSSARRSYDPYDASDDAGTDAKVVGQLNAQKHDQRYLICEVYRGKEALARR
jgi:hypothetical protein